MKCKYHRRCQATTQLYLSGGIGEKAARVEDIYSVWFIYTNYFSANSEKANVDFVSSRREKSSRMPRQVVVGLCWYPLTPALSLVGRGAVEYRAPQVMLHMACSLLRRIKCQLWNHLKDQRSVFLIRPEFWGSSLFFTAHSSMFYIAYLKLWTK